jgi:hypothetical protein
VDVPQLFVRCIRNAFADGYLARRCLEHIGWRSCDVLPPVFHRGQAAAIGDFLDGPVDLVLTSPPYFGMNDYVRSQYLSWLIFQWEGYEEDIQHELGSRRARQRAESVTEYLAQMRPIIKAMHSVLRRGGFLAIVLGCSDGRAARSVNVLQELQSSVEVLGFKRIWSGKRRVQFRKINNTPYREEAIWVYRR